MFVISKLIKYYMSHDDVYELMYLFSYTETNIELTIIGNAPEIEHGFECC